MLNKITFITTCKGRLEHVKQTMPKIMALGQVNVIFVDYGCPQKSGDWVITNFPSVKVINVTDDNGFCLSRARNIGAAQANTPWIFFIDADIIVKHDLGFWLSNNLKTYKIYRPSSINGKRDTETYGSFICPTNLFNSVGKYDEVFSGWGGEDEDIYRRLAKMSVISESYPSDYIKAIRHDDSERTKFYNITNKNLNHIISETYMAAKNYFSSTQYNNKQLSMSIRQQLMKRITDKVVEWDKSGRPENFPITLKFSHQTWLPIPNRLNIEATIQLKIIN
jgi:glycosyltransferase involved in cell wall biosynthesis